MAAKESLQEITPNNPMDVLIVGGGGREHAVKWKLDQSSLVRSTWCAPGNAGTAPNNLDFGSMDLDRIVSTAKDRNMVVFVGPEGPLGAGGVNACREAGVEAFGPTQEAELIESDKWWQYLFMRRQGIPCPETFPLYSSFEVLSYIENTKPEDYVLKERGFREGKGVYLPESVEHARRIIEGINLSEMQDGSPVLLAQRRIVGGQELSVIGISDGTTIRTCVPAVDYKPVGEGNTGPNTGGMGSYAEYPSRIVNTRKLQQIARTILQPAVKGMREEGHPFVGALFAGLVEKDGAIWVYEFNGRWGDPETEALMLLLAEDLGQLLVQSIRGELSQEEMLRFHRGAAVCNVLASGGYPGSYVKGYEINGLRTSYPTDRMMFHAGTKLEDGVVKTNGGRVLMPAARGRNLESSIKKVESMIGPPNGAHFQDMFRRTDIAKERLRK